MWAFTLHFNSFFMKQKTYSLVIVALGLLSFSSCKKFLDRAPDNQLDEATVFSKWDRVNGEANKLYREMRDHDKGIVGLQDFSISGIADECKATQVETATPDQFNFGSFGPSI